MSTLRSLRQTDNVIFVLVATVIVTKHAECSVECSNKHYHNCPLDHTSMTIWCDNTNLTAVPYPSSNNPLIKSQVDSTGSTAIHINSSCLEQLDPDTMSRYQRLKRFIANDNRVRHIQAGTFARNEKLQVLILARNRIDFIDDKAFVGLVNLEVLNLSGNRLNRISKKLLRKLTSLKNLDLSYNRIQSVHKHAFITLSEMTHISLAKNKMVEMDSDLLISMEKLKDFDSSRNKLVNFPQNFFRNNEELERIDISFNNISCLSDDVFISNTRLVHLHLSENNLQTPKKRWFEKINRKQDTFPHLKNNPWHCDCNSYSYYDFLRGLSSINKVQARFDIFCSTPSQHNNRLLSSFSPIFVEKCSNRSFSENNCEIIEIKRPRGDIRNEDNDDHHHDEDYDNLYDDSNDKNDESEIQRSTANPTSNLKPKVGSVQGDKESSNQVLTITLVAAAGFTVGVSIVVVLVYSRRFCCQSARKDEVKSRDDIEARNVEHGAAGLNGGVRDNRDASVPFAPSHATTIRTNAYCLQTENRPLSPVPNAVQEREKANRTRNEDTTKPMLAYHQDGNLPDVIYDNRVDHLSPRKHIQVQNHVTT